LSISMAEQEKVRINHEIRSHEVRVVGPEGENFGVLSLGDAVAKAEELGFDLIEVSAKAKPPVAKITDYGKFSYELKKKQKEIKAKAHTTETKNVQVKIGTGERDKEIKAERASEWLIEGHRVKVDLFLWGRYKYMEEAFLKERLGRFLAMISTPHKIAEEIKKSPKGFSCTIERDKAKPLPETKPELAASNEGPKEQKPESTQEEE
jgi:translation initiation factor IF-3